MAPHQRAMLARCIELEARIRDGLEKRTYAYMNDPPGTGKTYVALALACVSRQSSIITVPTHLLMQWKDEAIRMGCIEYMHVISSLNDLVNLEKWMTSVSSSPLKRRDYENREEEEEPTNQTATILKSEKRRHFIVPHILFESIMSVLSRVVHLSPIKVSEANRKMPLVERIIVDEPQCSPYIEVGRQYSIVAWLVSATPNVSPPSEMCVHCCPSFVESSFALPEPENWHIPCHENTIESVLSPFYIQMNDPEAALRCEAHDLGGAQSPNEYAHMLRNSLGESLKTAETDYNDVNSNRRYIPQNVKDIAKKKLDDAKSTMETFDNLCTSSEETVSCHVDKPSSLRSMMQGDTRFVLGESVIVFTRFAITPILNVLEECGVAYTLDAVEFSRTRNSRVLVLNPSITTGLNLPFVSDVIFWHRVPMLLATQIIGRAHRVGREAPLRVHLMTYGTPSSE